MSNNPPNIQFKDIIYLDESIHTKEAQNGLESNPDAKEGIYSKPTKPIEL